jgi:endonuclease-3
MPDLKEKTSQIIKLLKKEYPDARTALDHGNAFELLIATILSAQCTDARVNIVTADLFRKYRKPADYVAVPVKELAHDLRSINFHTNKAKNIQRTCDLLVENFGGEVPHTMDELLTLPGVARKTANVVLGNAFGTASGVVVDTHVMRLSQRLGLTKQTTPERIELDLQELVPKKHWVMFSHWLILHGRAVCKARNPQCQNCVIEKLCPSSRLKGDVDLWEINQKKKV